MVRTLSMAALGGSGSLAFPTNRFMPSSNGSETKMAFILPSLSSFMSTCRAIFVPLLSKNFLISAMLNGSPRRSVVAKPSGLELCKLATKLAKYPFLGHGTGNVKLLMLQFGCSATMNHKACSNSSLMAQFPLQDGIADLCFCSLRAFLKLSPLARWQLLKRAVPEQRQVKRL